MKVNCECQSWPLDRVEEWEEMEGYGSVWVLCALLEERGKEEGKHDSLSFS